MARHFIYIVNPISGTRNKKGLEKQIVEKTKAAGIPFEIFPSVASGDYSFLHPIIREKKITDIIIAGGDGTISQVIGSLLTYDLNFGIIPLRIRQRTCLYSQDSQPAVESAYHHF